MILLALPKSITYAQNPTFDICIRDYNDTNANGQFEEGEQPFLGLSVLVNQNGEVIGSLVTTADEDCIRSLPPAEYQISVEAQAQQTLTTASSFTINLVDQSITSDVGATLAEAPPVPGNDICIIIFEDSGELGRREAGENPISGIDVNLLTSDVIIQTLISTADEENSACFVGLPPGEFRIIVPSSANHLLTTRNDAGVEFTDTGSRITANFGAQKFDPLADGLTRSTVETEGELTLDRETRLIISVIGAGLAVLFMTGIGSLILGIKRR